MAFGGYVSYKFMGYSLLTAAKTLIYRMHRERSSYEPTGDKAERQSSAGESSIGVHPFDPNGKFFETDLSLGKSESASDIVMTDAVCTVSKAKNIIKTLLVGLSGSIKEYICDGDFEVTINVGLVAMECGVVVDQYPADGVRDLRTLLDTNEALYVDSEFLRLYDITRLVVVDYSIQQMTHSNMQMVTIHAISDEDYTIKSNEY